MPLQAATQSWAPWAEEPKKSSPNPGGKSSGKDVETFLNQDVFVKMLTGETLLVLGCLRHCRSLAHHGIKQRLWNVESRAKSATLSVCFRREDHCNQGVGSHDDMALQGATLLIQTVLYSGVVAPILTVLHQGTRCALQWV